MNGNNGGTSPQQTNKNSERANKNPEQTGKSSEQTGAEERAARIPSPSEETEGGAPLSGHTVQVLPMDTEELPAGGAPAPSAGGADGQQTQVRSPLYMRARLSGGFYSAVVLGMLLLNCVYSLTVMLIARAGNTEVGAVTGSEVAKYLSYLLYQLLYIGALAAVVFIYKERPRAFGYRKTSWKYFLIAIALQFGLLFSLDKVNSYFLELLELIGYSGGMSDASSLPSMAGAGIVGALAVVAVLPAFLEESIFRGVMLEGMKALGTAAACLLGGLCFSLFHQNPEQTIYQFICGAAFTLLAIRADSLLPAVAAHLLNNAFIVLELRFSFLQHVPLGGEIAIYVLSALCLVGSLVWLLFFDKRGNTKGQVPCKAFVKPALPGIIVCAVMWVYVFVVGVL